MNFLTAILLSSSILLPLITGLLIKNKTILLKKFITFLMFGFLFEIILIVTSFIGNNLIYFNVYTIFEIALIGVFFSELIENNFIKSIIWIVSIILIIEGVLGLKENVVDSITKFHESIFVILCGVTFFINSLKNTKINIGHYLLCFGLVLFFATSLTIFLYSEILIKKDPLRYTYLYTIHSYINFGVNIIYFIGILLLKIDDESYLESFKNKVIEEYIYMTTPSKKDLKSW